MNNQERDKYIYDKYKTGKYSYSEIGKEFNVTRERIRQIVLKEERKRRK